MRKNKHQTDVHQEINVKKTPHRKISIKKCTSPLIVKLFFKVKFYNKNLNKRMVEMNKDKKNICSKERRIKKKI